MPVRPKKLFIKRGAEGVSEDAYEYYTFGPFFDGEDWAKNKTPDELQAFWNKHKKVIMERFMADLRRKGKSWEGNRPEYFWKELKEPRLHIYVKLADNELWNNKIAEPNGREADYAYLKRLGLLEPWELESKEIAK